MMGDKETISVHSLTEEELEASKIMRDSSPDVQGMYDKGLTQKQIFKILGIKRSMQEDIVWITRRYSGSGTLYGAGHTVGAVKRMIKNKLAVIAEYAPELECDRYNIDAVYDVAYERKKFDEENGLTTEEAMLLIGLRGGKVSKKTLILLLLIYQDDGSVSQTMIDLAYKRLINNKDVVYDL